MEKILCAAIWVANKTVYAHQPKNIDCGMVVCGRRHHNCFATLSETGLRRDAIANNYPVIQGFITSGDLFVDRKIGAEIAFRAGQIPELVPELISEHLY